MLLTTFGISDCYLSKCQ